MKYSCFNAAAGRYRVFEDNRSFAVNGDLPALDLPPDVNGIGVPVSDVGRALPRGAREIGESWFPVGVVVRCERGYGSVGLGDLELGQTAKTLVGLTMAVLGAYLFYRVTK